MVNLKKIGVIATSALFLGATLGMASAASFSSSMLVSNGVAKAKVVTGTANPDATGLTADEASAKVITDAVAAKYTTTAGGAGITFVYEGQDIDDSSSTSGGGTSASGDDFLKTTFTGNDSWDGVSIVKSWTFWASNISSNIVGYQTGGTYLQQTNTSEKYGIKYDATGDGDVKDSDDYVVYNEIKIEDAELSDITIKPIMRVGNASYLKNRVFKLKGQKYLMTGFTDDENKIDLVPVSQKNVVNATNTGDIISSAVTIPGTDLKIGLTDYLSGSPSAKFAIIEGGAITGYIVRDSSSSPALSTTKDQELIDGYYIYPTKLEPTYVQLTIGKTADKFSISDGDTDVLGYAKAVVDDDDGWAASDSNEVRFEDSSITIEDDSKAVLGATNVYLKYDKDRKLDLVTMKSKTATSGSKLKSSSSPWNDFLNIDISSVSVSGGTTEAVQLSTLKDTAVTASDKSDYNLVLVGGPVANVLTAELLTATGATGTVEVVSDAFATGKYAIVVAGATRTETATAATALAGMV